MTSLRVAVIGGGVGGLVGAIRLAVAGHKVTIFERNRHVGGKLASTTIDGFTWDTGPSLLTLPHIFEELFADAGASFHERLKLVRLDPSFRYSFADGSSFEMHDQHDDSQAAVERFAGEGDSWQAFMGRAERIWQVSMRSFFVGPMDSPWQLAKRLKSPRDLLEIDAHNSLAERSTTTFKDLRMQMWLNRYATYSGSNPFSAPATLGCIPFVEQRFGAWHVQGGLARLADALHALATEVGVEVNTETDVSRIMTDGKQVVGVVVNGERHRADLVVANCDAEHLYKDLMPNRRRLERVHKAGRSSSGFALLLGLSETTPQLQHHNVFFSKDQRQEFDEIFNGAGVASDPTIYVCCSSTSDSSQAPAGKENWFVLVNVAAGASYDWHTYRDHLIDRLDVARRVQVSEMITPIDLAYNYRSPGGAIYGSSSNGKRSAFLRASNRGPVRGLYLLGGSSHPGGGLPLVAMSGAIVADMIKKDYA